MEIPEVSTLMQLPGRMYSYCNVFPVTKMKNRLGIVFRAARNRSPMEFPDCLARRGNMAQSIILLLTISLLYLLVLQY